jgi:hypothetical protein
VTASNTGLQSAVAQARRIIHDEDLDRLKQLLADYPALLAWRGEGDDDGGVLGIATDAYGDAGDPARERSFTRAAAAELLIDAGAVVAPSVCRGILQSRARGLLQLFERKGVLPRTLPFLAALGDLESVRVALDGHGRDLTAVTDAFVCACRFHHEAAAAFLLDRAIALDHDLETHVDDGIGRRAFVMHFVEHGRADAARRGLWLAFVMDRISRSAHDGDVTALVSGLQRERRLLGDDFVDFQDSLISEAILNDRQAVLVALLELDPAIARRRPPPPSQALEHVFTYGTTHLLPLLTPIWPVPDDLPHAAGMGDLARVKGWFDDQGRSALGDVTNHMPATSLHPREPQWGKVGEQEVLDTALAWAVINRHFTVADFLLEHGADVDTRWNSHEPASILHHLVFLSDPYASMRYLVDRGIDMTRKDYRWNATAQGWARYGNNDEAMAVWLEEAERQQAHTKRDDAH